MYRRSEGNRAHGLGSESGTVLVLFALLLPVFLMVGAIVIDVGYWYVAAKKAQIAADAGALAAAQALPNVGTATAHGKNYAVLNVPDQSVPDAGMLLLGDPVVVTPYNGKASEVEVTVKLRATTFLGKLIGVGSVDITRRAVAEKLSGDGKLAIFSHNRFCESGQGLEFNGENVNINGLVHSNGQFRVDAGPFWAADGTISRNNCVSSVDEDAYSQFGPDPTACAGQPCRLPRDVFETLSWPLWFTPAQFGWMQPASFAPGRCRFQALKVEITATQVKLTAPDQTINHTGTIPTGTYCARESFIIGADNLTGTITAVAPEIKVDGNNLEFIPYDKDVLFFTVPNTDMSPDNDGSLAAGGNPTCVPNPAKEMQLNGNSHTWSGIIFSPCGRILVNVGGSTIGSPALVGTIIGKQVKVDGNDFFMVGDYTSSETIAIALVE